MIIEKKELINITGGPCLSELFDALKYAYCKDHPFQVYFRFNGEKHAARISAIEHEDGSGQSFLVKGYTNFYRSRDTDQSVPNPFTGYYSALNRTGQLEIAVRYIDSNRAL